MFTQPENACISCLNGGSYESLIGSITFTWCKQKVMAGYCTTGCKDFFTRLCNQASCNQYSYAQGVTLIQQGWEGCIDMQWQFMQMHLAQATDCSNLSNGYVLFRLSVHGSPQAMHWLPSEPVCCSKLDSQWQQQRSNLLQPRMKKKNYIDCAKTLCRNASNTLARQ